MFHRPAPRGLAAIAVLLAWTASLVWLGVRHFGEADSEALSGEASLRIAPGDAWLAIMVGDVQVGTAGVTLDTLSPGFRIQESVTMELPKGSGLVHSARFTRVVVGPTLSLQEIATSWSRPGRHSAYSLARDGDTLVAHYEPGPARRVFHATEPAGVLHIFPYQLALSRGMTRERQLNQLLIDGWPATARQSRITVGADTVVTYPDSVVKDRATGQWRTVTTLAAGGVIMTVDGAMGPYRLVADKRGRLQGLETLFGVRWVRRNFDLAMDAFHESLATDTARILAVYPVVRMLSAQPRSAPDSGGERRFLLGHRDGSPMIPAMRDLLTGGRQRVVGDTLIIAAADAPPPAVVERDADLRTVDPLVNSNGEIYDMARAILRSSHGGDSTAALITWLQQSIMIDTTTEAPEDARETYTLQRGRPDGLVRLFVAMARSAKMTARYVTGVLPRGDTLYTHAWAEVRNSRGEWIAVDPVRDQQQASTGLIRLAWGGSSYPEDMLYLLANARITPIPSSRVP